MNLEQRFVNVDGKLCTGCAMCELVCSHHHEGCYSPRLSRIRLVRFEDRGVSVPTTCAYCERPACEQVCPTGAFTRDAATGAARVNEARCIGCKECVTVCPLGAIDLHPTHGIPMRCDLCDGDPACVEVCPTGALALQLVRDAVREKRRAVQTARNRVAEAGRLES
jgi:Fe-S-cluster-containing hydrogenase component 2